MLLDITTSEQAFKSQSKRTPFLLLEEARGHLPTILLLQSWSQ
jgi:hypothetical protein